MRTVRLGLMSLVTLTVLVWTASLPPTGAARAARASSPTTTRISGRVTAGDTGAGLAGVTVLIYDSGGVQFFRRSPMPRAAMRPSPASSLAAIASILVLSSGQPTCPATLASK